MCNEITRQVFPLLLDIDDPGFRHGMEQLRLASDAMSAASAKGGVTGALAKAGALVKIAATLVGLYLQPVKSNPLPATTRLQPVW